MSSTLQRSCGFCTPGFGDYGVDITNSKCQIQVPAQNNVSLQQTSVERRLNQPDQGSSQPKLGDDHLTYNRNPGTGKIRGQLYKIKLSMLFLLQGLTKKADGKIDGFDLAANMHESGDFKDVVFKFKNRKQSTSQKSKIVFLHSKHVDNTENKKITLRVLEADPKEEDHNFDLNLENHFRSYRKIKQHFAEGKHEHPIFGSSLKDIDFDFILYTNALSTFDENPKIFKKIDVDDEDILYSDDSPETHSYYQIVIHNDQEDEKTEEDAEILTKQTEQISSILENSSDCRKLAKNLAKSVFPKTDGNMAEIVNQGILKEYHIPLSTAVIAKDTKKPKTGKFRINFLDCDECLSQGDRNFRKVFFEEATRVAGKSENELKEDLRSKNIKLSDKFGESTGVKEVSEILSMPNDRVTEDEIIEFLSKLKIFVGQPGEDQLTEVIKEKIKTTFDVKQCDVHSIYVDVKTKVERWWKGQNYYLTERNSFLEDSLRICIFFDVKRPVELFSGRKQQLNDLHTMMLQSPEEATVISQMTVVTGLGGIGKTELARRYVYEHSPDYDNNVIWINAEGYMTLVESFRRLAQHKLKISTKNVDGKEKHIKCVVQDVYEFFSKRKSLFIFDNAEKYKTTEDQDAGIDKFLPLFPQNSKTYILITSRSQEWEKVKTLPLNEFTNGEAAQYIKRSLNIAHKSQEKDVQQLSETLQCFPLALQQAVSYIIQEKKKLTVSGGQFSINDYLEEYKNEGTEEKLLDFQPLNNNSYGRTTFITWKITLQKIVRMNYGDKALNILNIMAYFAPDSISTRIFLEMFSDKRELGSALQLLKQYSIIGLQQGEANIHRLVQQVIRAELKRHDKENSVLKDALHLVQKGMKEGNEMNCKYVSHAVSAWSYASKYGTLVKSFTGLPCDIMSVLDTNVRYEEAFLFGNKAHVQLEEVLGADHGCSLLILNAIAVALDHSGKYDKALKAYERVISKFVQTLGSDHHCTLSVKHNMVGSLKNQGKHEEALKICEEVLNKRNQTLGDSHPDTLTTMNDMAIVLQHQGKYGDALKVYQTVLEKREQILGCDHRDTLMTKHGMALIYYLDRKYSEALQVYQEVLDKRNYVLGPDHPDTLMTKNNMASVLRYIGKYDDALVILQEVVSKTEKILGFDHPHTLLSKDGIGLILYELGRYDEALLIIQEVLDDRQRVLDSNHPETLRTRHNKALALTSQGKYEEALLMYSELLETENFVFGCEHPTTLSTQHNKALVLSMLGKYDESLRVYRDVLGNNERSRGLHHPETLATQHNIAHVLHCQGKYHEAQKLYEDVLENRSKILDSKHPDILMTKANIASVLCESGSYNESLEIYREVLDKRQEAFGPDHPDTLNVERNIAGVIHRMGRCDEALTAYEKVLEKGKQILNSNHPENLLTLGNIAGVLDDKGYYHSALKTYEEVLNKREQFLGTDHPDTLMTKYCIASVFRKRGDYNKAVKIYYDVLRKRTEILGPDHPNTLDTQNSIAAVFDAQSNYKKSLEMYQKVLNKRKQFLGPDHPDTLTTMNDMARSLCNQGKHGEALSAYYTVLDKRKNVLGSLHPSTLFTQNCIAAALHSQGNYVEANKAYEEVLDAKNKTLGPDHPDTLFTVKGIAALLDDQGHHDLSVKAHQEVLDKMKKILGPNNPDTLTTENNMAGVLFSQKLYEEALKMYRDVFDKTNKISGPDHPCTLLAQNNIAVVLHAQKNYEDALNIYQEVLGKRKLILPPDHPDILVSLSNVADLLYDKECFDLSLKIYQDVLAKREMILSSSHPDTLRSKNDVAAILFNQGDYEKALEIYYEVLNKRENMLGPDNVSVLVSLDNVAVALHRLEKYDEALQTYLKVLDKRKQVLGIDHPDTLCTMYNIATVLYVCGNYEDALKIDQEVLDRRKHIFGPDHPCTLLTVNRMVSVLLDQGVYCDVFKTFLELLEMLDKEKILELCRNSSLSTENVLQVLARSDKLDVIQYLIENGADVLSRNEHDTLLHQAVNNNNSKVIKLILKEIKQKCEDMALHIDAPDKDGDTPLMWAAETGNVSSARVLLEYEASVNARNKSDWTALHWAAKGGHKEIIDLLLAKEADTSLKDKDGRTALDVAYESLEHDVGDEENLQTVTALLLSVTQ